MLLNPEYKNILLEISNNDCEVDLKIHYYLSLPTLSVLQNISNNILIFTMI